MKKRSAGSGKLRGNVVIVILLIVLLLVFFLSFLVGRYSMSLREIWDSLSKNYSVTDPAYNSMVIMKTVRLPRILAALLIGGALSMSGAAFQGVFGNPLVSPDLLGTSSGAGLGAAIAILSGLGPYGILFSALGGGLLATTITVLISRAIMRYKSGIVVYVLVGIVISAALEAGISISKICRRPLFRSRHHHLLAHGQPLQHHDGITGHHSAADRCWRGSAHMGRLPDQFALLQ